MAAEVISDHGLCVDLYDAMPSVGRKFLMAGKSGLNLTHAEPVAAFLSRYGARRGELEPLIREFGPQALREWAAGLGITTFVGSSQRVFPNEMKAAPLLRAWLHRLRGAGVRFHMRHRWIGFADDGRLRMQTPDGEILVQSDATVLALGGGSWSRLGSNGAWVEILQRAGIDIAPLQASNCGFDVSWSAYLRERFAGTPVKSVCLSVTDKDNVVWRKPGELVITDYGIEGGLVYAFSSCIRERIARDGNVTVYLDLLPALSVEHITARLAQPRRKRSLTEHLRKQLSLTGVKVAMLYECADKHLFDDSLQLATFIKALPVICERARPIDEAISTAGGVPFEALNEQLMLQGIPGVFCAGEMLDWDAPTGGYLLTACFASGHAAGQGVVRYLA
ncbi:MAG: TIGR03862 family flavoprotein [Gammaproteobacteria bacterium]|nr:TIGR03862 family flavoprotein [Gammaproteobacteria bacterium]